MYKKNILFFSLIALSTTIFAATDSCKDYSDDAKNICTGVSNTKTNLYNKYAMNTAAPTEDKRSTSSCDSLNGIEKDTCITKNNVVSQHSLTKQTSSSSVTPPPQTQQQAATSTTTTTPVSSQPQSNASNHAPAVQEQNTGTSKVNIFNN